mgnify:CR=1 FL=1
MAQIDRFMRGLARWLALIGGIALVAIIATTTLSILGRLLNSIGHSDIVTNWLPSVAPLLQRFRPITGDFELVEVGVAFAIMAFIPWCQINRRHARVEALPGLLPAQQNRWLALLWEIVFCAAYLLIAWRLIVGAGDKLRYGETSFMLQFPVWWGYAAVAFAACLASIVAVWSVCLHWRETMGCEPLSKSETQVV